MKALRNLSDVSYNFMLETLHSDKRVLARSSIPAVGFSIQPKQVMLYEDLKQRKLEVVKTINQVAYIYDLTVNSIDQ